MTKQSEPSKVNKIIIALAGLLMFVIGVLLGYAAFNQGLFETKTNPKTNTENVNSKTNSEKEVELTEKEKERVTEIASFINNGLSNYYPITDLSVISNQDLLRLGKSDLFDYKLMNSFTASQIDENIKKYFGNSVVVNHEDIKCFDEEVEPMFIYDGKETYSFNQKHLGHGASSSRIPYTYYESGVRKGSTITANFKAVYQEYSGVGPSYRLFARYNDDNPIYTATDPENANITKELASQYKNQVPTIKFTFDIKNDNVYSIKSITIE